MPSNDMPKEIYAYPADKSWQDKEHHGATKYIRADKAPSQVDGDVQAALDDINLNRRDVKGTGHDYVSINIRQETERTIKRAMSATKHESVPEKVIAWECKRGLGIKRFITQKQYEGFSDKIRAFYKQYKCLSCLEAAESATVSDELIATRYKVSTDTEVSIEVRGQLNGDTKWAVMLWGKVLNKQGEWEYEPLPSSREDDFIERTRFDSPQDALNALQQLTKKD